MEIIGEELVFDGRFIAVKKISFKGSDGKTYVWETVKRKMFGKIVSICAVTRDKEIILNKIFRIPANRYVIEFPAGLMDKPGEDPADAIKRELLEETGYNFEGRPELLIEGPFNAGLLADELMVFYALGAWKAQEPHLEPTEDIEVITVPVNSLIDFVLYPPEGCLPDMKLLSILPILERRGAIEKEVYRSSMSGISPPQNKGDRGRWRVTVGDAKEIHTIGWVDEKGFYARSLEGKLVQVSPHQLLGVGDNIDLIRLARIEKEMEGE